MNSHLVPLSITVTIFIIFIYLILSFIFYNCYCNGRVTSLAEGKHSADPGGKKKMQSENNKKKKLTATMSLYTDSSGASQVCVCVKQGQMLIKDL